jgi:hypothetical protein
MAGYSFVRVPAQPMRLTRILARSPAQVVRARDSATSPPTAVARLGVVQATGLASLINPRIALGQVGVTGVRTCGLCRVKVPQAPLTLLVLSVCQG